MLLWMTTSRKNCRSYATEPSKRIFPACIAGYDRVGVDAWSTKSSRSRLSSGFDLCRWRRSRRRQRGGRRSIPRVLSVHDLRLVLAELTEPYRTMVLVAACLGLRASEIIGLQWGDFNWEDHTLLVRRSVVFGEVGTTKTEASRLPLPVDPSLSDVLRAHWQRSLDRRASCRE